MTVLSNRDYSRAIATIAVFLMVACTKTTSTPINPENTTSISTVQVFYSPPTDREYTELGLVTTQTGQTIFLASYCY
jgi:hypothetical protein